MAALEFAAALFDARGIFPGEITPLESFGSAVLILGDPGTVAVELTARRGCGRGSAGQPIP